MPTFARTPASPRYWADDSGFFFVFRVLLALGAVLADIAAFAERRPLPGSLFLTNRVQRA
jgi:hypothetical protein